MANLSSFAGNLNPNKSYEVCYDWSKGVENHNPATAKTYIYLHSPQESEVKAKPRLGTGGRK